MDSSIAEDTGLHQEDAGTRPDTGGDTGRLGTGDDRFWPVRRRHRRCRERRRRARGRRFMPARRPGSRSRARSIRRIAVPRRWRWRSPSLPSGPALRNYKCLRDHGRRRGDHVCVDAHHPRGEPDGLPREPRRLPLRERGRRKLPRVGIARRRGLRHRDEAPAHVHSRRRVGLGPVAAAQRGGRGRRRNVRHGALHPAPRYRRRSRACCEHVRRRGRGTAGATADIPYTADYYFCGP